MIRRCDEAWASSSPQQTRPAGARHGAHFGGAHESPSAGPFPPTWLRKPGHPRAGRCTGPHLAGSHSAQSPGCCWRPRPSPDEAGQAKQAPLLLCLLLPRRCCPLDQAACCSMLLLNACSRKCMPETRLEWAGGGRQSLTQAPLGDVTDGRWRRRGSWVRVFVKHVESPKPAFAVAAALLRKSSPLPRQAAVSPLPKQRG